MDASEQITRLQPLTRRRLLLATGAGLAAVMAACARNDQQARATPTETSPQPASPSPEPAPEPAASPEPPPPAAPVSLDVLCRESWGAQPPRGAGTPHTPVRMTIHHTAAFLGSNSNAVARLQQHQSYHQDQQGWIDIAYHFSVDRNGNVYELRDPLLVGDTATEYDPTGHFLVVAEGNFDEEEVSEAQLDAAAKVFAWAAQTYGIAVSPDTLGAHKDFAGTACPGASLDAHVKSGDLQARVKEQMDAGTITMNMICGPDADNRIAAIQAGR